MADENATAEAEKPAAKAKKPAAPKRPSKPRRVKLRNTKEGNGAIGATATPLERDADRWLAAGWVRAD